MKKTKIKKSIPIILISLFALYCSSAQKVDPIITENQEFLQAEPERDEVFRVVLSSKRYYVSQIQYGETIQRAADQGGDQYICQELGRYDKIDEVREGLIMIWLYPDNGRLMKVRPMRLTYLLEIDNLIVEDVQRWSFNFPKGVISPHFFGIKYRVILKKRQSDEDILREVRENIKEKGTKRY